MTPEALAHIAYEAYCNHSPHATSRTGMDVLPRWGELNPKEMLAWFAAAKAVKANVLSGFTRVGEGQAYEDV